MTLEFGWDLFSIASKVLVLLFGALEFVRGNRMMALVFLGTALAMTRNIALVVIGFICMLVGMFFFLKSASQGPSK